jgi:hypothetical protein
MLQSDSFTLENKARISFARNISFVRQLTVVGMDSDLDCLFSFLYYMIKQNSYL